MLTIPTTTTTAAQLPSVDAVEYWRTPDKAGWLGSQAEVMRLWRRRWFVLKQGYLFRFLSPDVSGEATCMRAATAAAAAGVPAALAWGWHERARMHGAAE